MEEEENTPWYMYLFSWSSSFYTKRSKWNKKLTRQSVLQPPPIVLSPSSSSSLSNPSFSSSSAGRSASDIRSSSRYTDSTNATGMSTVSSSNSVRWVISILVTILLTYQFTLYFHTLGRSNHFINSSSSTTTTTASTSSSAASTSFSLAHLRDKLWSSISYSEDTTLSSPPVPCRITKCKPCPIHPSPSSYPRTHNHSSASLCSCTNNATEISSITSSSSSSAAAVPKVNGLILDPSITKQRCYQLEDESELCIYDGPVCYDGNTLIIIVADGSSGLPPSMAAVSETWKKQYQKVTGIYPVSDTDLDTNRFDPGLGPRNEGGITPYYRHSFYENGPCFDWRTMESSHACTYHNRPYREAPAVAKECTNYNASYTNDGMGSSLYAQSCGNAVLSTGIRGRAWGPDGKTMPIYEMTRTDFISFQHAAERLKVWDGTMIELGEVVKRIEDDENFTHAEYPKEDDDDDGSPSGNKKGKKDADGLIDETQTKKFRRVTIPFLPPSMQAAENAAVEIAQTSKRISRSSKEELTREEILHGRYIHWLEGPLYISSMMTGWIDHPWHATTALSQLWYAKRHNYTFRTIPRIAAGFIPDDTTAPNYGKMYNPDKKKFLSRRQSDLSEPEKRTYDRFTDKNIYVNEIKNSFSFTDNTLPNEYLVPMDDPRYGYHLSQANIPFPSMDNLLIHIGDPVQQKFGKQNLGKWLTGIYPLLTQPHTTLLTKRSLERDLGVGRANVQALLCSTKTVVLGLQPRIFTGPADASAFRSQAWAIAGINLEKIRSYDRYPPRKITVIGRSTTRALLHREKIIRILKLTGLPYEYVNDIGLVPWKEQVTLMAGTGILISAHGAGLTNIMYLPAHAVVIEAFPYLMNWPLYRRLAEVMNLYYYRLPSSRPYKSPSPSSASSPTDSRAFHPDDNTGFELMDAESFYMHCEDPQRVSSLDANLLTACNGRSKNVKINLNFRLFTETLVTALDDIGCRARQFLPRQISALIAAQHAVERIKKDNLPITIPSLPTGPELKARFRSNQRIDPYYPLSEYDDGSDPWSDEGINTNGELTPRAEAGILIALRLGIDLRASLDSSDVVSKIASKSTLRKKSKWKTVGLYSNPSYLAFYQPEEDSSFILNLAGKCLENNVIFQDRNPWDESHRRQLREESDTAFPKLPSRPNGFATTEDTSILDPEVSALLQREQEKMMQSIANDD